MKVLERVSNDSMASTSWSYTQAARLLLESDREQALDLLEKATDEAERINADDRDASFALINVANQLLAIDHSRAWEVMSKTVKFAKIPRRTLRATTSTCHQAG